MERLATKLSRKSLSLWRQYEKHIKPMIHTKFVMKGEDDADKG